MRIQMLISHDRFDLVPKTVEQFFFRDNGTPQVQIRPNLRKRRSRQLILSPLIDVIRHHGVRDDDSQIVRFGSHQLTERQIVFSIPRIEFELRGKTAHACANGLFERLLHKDVSDTSLQHQLANSFFIKVPQCGRTHDRVCRTDPRWQHPATNCTQHGPGDPILDPTPA